MSWNQACRTRWKKFNMEWLISKRGAHQLSLSKRCTSKMDGIRRTKTFASTFLICTPAAIKALSLYQLWIRKKPSSVIDMPASRCWLIITGRLGKLPFMLWGSFHSLCSLSSSRSGLTISSLISRERMSNSRKKIQTEDSLLMMIPWLSLLMMIPWLLNST